MNFVKQFICKCFILTGALRIANSGQGKAAPHTCRGQPRPLLPVPRGARCPWVPRLSASLPTRLTLFSKELAAASAGWEQSVGSHLLWENAFQRSQVNFSPQAVELHTKGRSCAASPRCFFVLLFFPHLNLVLGPRRPTSTQSFLLRLSLD